MKSSTILRNILFWIGSILLPMLFWLPEILKKVTISGWIVVAAVLGIIVATCMFLMTGINKQKTIILMLGFTAFIAIAFALAHFLTNYSVPGIFFGVYYIIDAIALAISVSIVLISHFKRHQHND